MKTALMLLEIQNDYFTNGRIPLEKSDEVATNARSLLQIFREEKMPVIHIQQISTQPDAAYLLPCTKGADFHLSLQPIQHETVVKKHYYNSFKDTVLLNYLIKHQINHLVLCGMMTHTSIAATAYAAYDLGFHCTVVQDACATQALEFNQVRIPVDHVHLAFLASLQTPYANVLNTYQLIQKMNARVPVDA